MAATLVYIKARMLIPRDAEEEEDPREPLVQQLIEHQTFRDVAGCFHDMSVMRQASYGRGREIAAEFMEDDDVYVEVGVFDLINSFHSILARHVVRKSLEFERIKVTIAEQVGFILRKLNHSQKSTVYELFAEFKIKTTWIVAFLALLELMRLKYVKAFQNEMFDDVILVRNYTSLTEPEIVEISNRFGE